MRLFLACLKALFSCHPVDNLRAVFNPPPAKEAAPILRRVIAYNVRYGVYTAYMAEDIHGAQIMIAPRLGMAVFTDRTDVPRTGTRADLDRLSQLSGRPLEFCGEYTLYCICTFGFGATPAEDIRDYGGYVLSYDQALARWRSSQTDQATSRSARG